MNTPTPAAIEAAISYLDGPYSSGAISNLATIIDKFAAARVAEEREACASLLYVRAEQYRSDDWYREADCTRACAAAIRSRTPQALASREKERA